MSPLCHSKMSPFDYLGGEHATEDYHYESGGDRQTGCDPAGRRYVAVTEINGAF